MIRQALVTIDEESLWRLKCFVSTPTWLFEEVEEKCCWTECNADPLSTIAGLVGGIVKQLEDDQPLDMDLMWQKMRQKYEEQAR